MRIPRPRLRCDCGAEWSFGQAYIERGPVSAAIAGRASAVRIVDGPFGAVSPFTRGRFDGAGPSR